MNKMNNMFAKAGAVMLSAACLVTPAAGVLASATNVMAASKLDTIDENAKGSINLYKYDFTAATEDGIDVSQWKATGEENSDVEDKMQRYLIDGVEFTYAKVADINTVSNNGKIDIEYNIPAALATALGLSGKTTYTATDINKALASNLEFSGTQCRNDLENYMTGDANRKTMITGANGKAGNARADGLALGLYLIIETKVPANVHETVDPFFVTLPMTDVTGDHWFYDLTLYPKNQTDIPTLDKVVRQHDDAELYNKPEYGDVATGSEGDVMDYLFISRLPKIDSKATYLKEYTFEDKMDRGLTYNKDVVICFYQNKEDAEANNMDNAVAKWTQDSGKFTVDYTGVTNNLHGMTVKPTEAGLNAIDPSLSQHYMVISYSATVNSDATPILGDVGNTNDVKLTWRRTNSEFSDVLQDRARVYTFGINLKKEFTELEGTTPDATKVQFVLKNVTDGHYVNATRGGDGVYYVTDATKSADADAEAAEENQNTTKFVPAADGTLIINGLEANEYEMTEVKTTDGYALLKSPITINITSTSDSITATKTTLYDTLDKEQNPNKQVIDVRNNNASATVDGKATAMSSVTAIGSAMSENARVDMTITNTPSFKLPMTGGTGTILFTLGGCVLAVGGIAMVTGKKSKKAEN